MKTGHLKSLAKPVPVCTVAHVLKKKIWIWSWKAQKKLPKRKKNEEKSILVPIQNMKEYCS